MGISQIKIDDLKGIVLNLLTSLESSEGAVIEVKNDFYWDISSEELYNVYEEPKELTIGQLSDDLNEIARLIENPSEGIPYDLKRVSNILKALSIENPTVF